MPQSIRLVVNVPGYNAYRNSAEVQALLGELAGGIAGRFSAAAEAYGAAHDIAPLPGGQDVVTTVTSGGTRARAYVRANSLRAKLAEAHDRALLQSIGG